MMRAKILSTVLRRFSIIALGELGFKSSLLISFKVANFEGNLYAQY